MAIRSQWGVWFPREAADRPSVTKRIFALAICAAFAVVSRASIAVDAAPPSTMSGAPAASSSGPAIVVPPGKLYVCVTETGGVRSETPIEFAPNVYPLCAKHPEMGPCQYARNECRRSGGRVYAADGKEITMQTEAEYDKKVMRVKVQ